MKSILEINEKKVPAVRINPSLDKYDNVVLFPEKLAKVNKQIKQSGFPTALQNLGSKRQGN